MSSLGPPDMGTVLKALCSVLGDKKIKGLILTAAGSGFILALVPLPIQVEGTDLLFFFFPFLCPEGMTLHILEPDSPICPTSLSQV